MAKFLDENGVKKLWSRIQEYVYECCCSKGGGGDSGYECTTSFEEVFSESGTTTKEESYLSAQYVLDYTDYIDADEIKVVFNDTEYTCPKKVIANYAVYGSYSSSFTDYPFAIGFSQSQGNLNLLQTKDPINFTIEVDVPVTTATVTPCFETAVKTVMDGKGVKVIHIKENKKEGGYVCDTSCNEITETIQNGGYVVAYYNGNFYNLDTTDIELTPEKPSSSTRSKAPLLRVEGSRSTITFAKVVINTDTQQAERRGFTFDTSDCSITYFPSSL